MSVYFYDLFDAGGFEEGGGDAFLDAEDDAVGGRDADGGAAEFDGFEGVFDLEEAAFGGECAVYKFRRFSGCWNLGKAYLTPRSVRY